jgi:class 3 adenylate cyclase
MFEYENRNLVATIVFVDIEAYSKLAVSGQMEVKTRFNEMINESLAGVAANERILLDTGDGAALCFLGDPEHGLLSAHSLCSAARESDGTARMALRIGINMGPIQLIKDFNGQPNVIGDAINTAQRIMSFADPQQILVSRSFYDLVSCLKPEYGRMFNHLGTRQDKHARDHEVYAVDISVEVAGNTSQRDKATAPPPAKETAAAKIPGEALAELEKIFARYIGPIARVLVRNHSRECRDMNQLCQLLADNIGEEAQRAAFLREVPGLKVPQTSSVGETPAQAPDTTLDAAQITAVERLLAAHIGPMAKFLVRRAQDKCGNITELCAEVAQHIENKGEREKFVARCSDNTS